MGSLCERWISERPVKIATDSGSLWTSPYRTRTRGGTGALGASCARRNPKSSVVRQSLASAHVYLRGRAMVSRVRPRPRRRRVSADYPRTSASAASTRLRGLSASPRTISTTRGRDRAAMSYPRRAAAASFVSADYPRRGRGIRLRGLYPRHAAAASPRFVRARPRPSPRRVSADSLSASRRRGDSSARGRGAAAPRRHTMHQDPRGKTTSRSGRRASWPPCRSACPRRGRRACSPTRSPARRCRRGPRSPSGAGRARP